MGTVLTIAMEIAFFIGAFLISDLVKVKPAPIKVRVDQDRKAR